MTSQRVITRLREVLESIEKAGTAGVVYYTGSVGEEVWLLEEMGCIKSAPYSNADPAMGDSNTVAFGMERVIYFYVKDINSWGK